MTDRELLELAAKAAGMRVRTWEGHSGTRCAIDDDRHGRMVMVNAGSGDPAGAMKLAQAECQKHGRHARLNSKPYDDRQWVFDCVR